MALETKSEDLISERKKNLKIISKLETIIEIKETELSLLNNQLDLLENKIKRQKEDTQYLVEDNEVNY